MSDEVQKAVEERKKEKEINFETAVRRSITGEKVNLTSIGNPEDPYWIMPRKFSVQGMDAFVQLQAKMTKRVNMGVFKAAIQKMQEKSLAVTSENLLANISQDEMVDALQALPEDAKLRAPLIRLFCLEGIAKHNLNGEESDKVTEKLVDTICQSNVVATEIYTIVGGYNSFFSQPQPEQK